MRAARQLVAGLKWIDPVVVLGHLAALARDVPWEVDLVATELLWSGSEQGPWLTSVGDATRDILAAIPSPDSPNLAEAWDQTEELSWNGPMAGEDLLPTIEQLVGLARRAQEVGDHLYCWCSL
jgi:hypothetical protein